jgi:hypothetical protein
MKAVLTCDHVFDVLTREPFPSGGVDDEVVESHLAVCHECRQLAEAFRPAVGLFHEALSAGFDNELPMYRGRLKSITQTPPEKLLFTPRRVECSRSEQRHSLTRRSLAIAASLVLVGSVVVAMLVALPRTGDSVPAASTVRATQDRDYTLLATLEIPGNCRSLLEYSDRALVTEFVCCTKCHHATSRVASTNLAIGRTSAACAACHDRMLGEALSMVMPRNQLCESRLAYGPIQNL